MVTALTLWTGTPVYALIDGVVCDPAKDSQCVWVPQIMDFPHRAMGFLWLGTAQSCLHHWARNASGVANNSMMLTPILPQVW